MSRRHAAPVDNNARARWSLLAQMTAVVLLLAAAVLTRCAAAPYSLSTNHLSARDSLGIDVDGDVSLSWLQSPAVRTETQTAFRIQLQNGTDPSFANVVWDSDIVRSRCVIDLAARCEGLCVWLVCVSISKRDAAVSTVAVSTVALDTASKT